MDTELSVSAYQEFRSHLADADPAQQMWHSLEQELTENELDGVIAVRGMSRSLVSRFRFRAE